MYYSPDLLSKRRGKFGIIWLASRYNCRERNRLSRREYQSVNLTETCEELERLVYPSPALALRLSSVLFIGLLRVYERQLVFLYGDIKQLWIRLQRHTEIIDGDGAINLPARAGGMDPFDPLNPCYVEAVSEWKLFLDGRMTEGIYYNQLLAQQAAYHTAPETMITKDPFLESSYAALEEDRMAGNMPSLQPTVDDHLATLADADFGPIENLDTDKPVDWNDLSPRLLQDEPDDLPPVQIDNLNTLTEDNLNMSTTAEPFSLANQDEQSASIDFTLSAIQQATIGKKKKRVNTGPLKNQRTSLTDAELRRNQLDTGRIVKRPDFDQHPHRTASAQEMINRPAGLPEQSWGRDLLEFWKLWALQPPPSSQKRANWIKFAYGQYDLSNVVAVSFDDMAEADETQGSIEVARHETLPDHDEPVSLGGSDFSIARSHSNASLDTAHGSFPNVGHVSLENLSGISDRDRDIATPQESTSRPTSSLSRSASHHARTRFSMATPLHQIQEEYIEAESPLFHTGPERLKSIAAFKDLHSVLEDALHNRDAISFHHLLPSKHTPRTTAATALYHLLDMSSKNMINLKQAHSHNIFISKGSDF
ncbi:uncharacterized protein LOC135824755 [Sycon ciliatum]|uniref:uncharacterized protein LOC135824755 n=1 Tax=Sycon ciliatum TaxID=27933 RepID=UPI0020ABF9B5|eukprot:scpid44886/ scgid12261/ Meiotic recombination protein REC8 homolog; Cohesin Rec8p